MALADLSIGATPSFGVLWNEFRGLAGRPEIWSGGLVHGGDPVVVLLATLLAGADTPGPGA